MAKNKLIHNYNIPSLYYTKCIKNAFFLQKICVCQKKAVPLQPLLEKTKAKGPKVLSTRISVLHRILVPRSEVRLLGGQQREAYPKPLPIRRGEL